MERKKVHINITIDEDLNEWVEEISTELRMNRSQFINNLISAGKDDVKVLKAIGAFGLAKVARKIKEKALNIDRKGFAVRGSK